MFLSRLVGRPYPSHVVFSDQELQSRELSSILKFITLGLVINEFFFWYKFDWLECKRRLIYNSYHTAGVP